MRNFTIYLVLLTCLLASKMMAQDSFEKRAKSIANTIEMITNEEKSALKLEVDLVNDELINGNITKEEAELRKRKLAEVRATNIENRVALEQEALKNLVQEKVDGQISESDTLKKPYKLILKWEKGDKGYENNNRNEKRTTSQFVFALGLNNVATEGEVKDSDFRYLASHFYEWGFTSNTRLFKENNLLHLKYGFSVMYNNLRPTDNRFFEVNGKQTVLQANSNDPAGNSIKIEEARFKNVYLVLPLHFEFDFSEKKTKEDQTYFRTHQSWRIGLGGYIGTRLKTKQILKYQVDNHDVTDKLKGGFNTNDFIYGLSTYVGYKATSLYLKYDLNPIFKENVLKQNNVSLGLRFDFN
ncbi:hypothetical protein [Flavobacterium sp. WC2430]|jgi:hypothetical protein|uniref:Outer membrane beta-barrel protein n=2 Tax=unclassified Flavobacterium TaxID=196869 RepID=A0AB39WH30_9FLAO